MFRFSILEVFNVKTPNKFVLQHLDIASKTTIHLWTLLFTYQMWLVNNFFAYQEISPIWRS